jgi:cytochrome c-type protein NapB
MRKILFAALAGALLALGPWGLAGAGELKSLRDVAINANDKSIEQVKQVTVEGGFTRSWKEAPPQIPHTIDKDQITLKDNSCMRCHDEANYKKEKAPRIGDSHYVDAEGKKLANMNMRRWFCTQCHVPQLDIKPVVDNAFAGQPFKR